MSASTASLAARPARPARAARSPSAVEAHRGGRPAATPARSATTNVQPATSLRAHVGEALVAVVAAGQHLEHAPRCPGRRGTRRWPSSRTSGSVLRDHLGDALGAVRRVRVRVEVPQVLADVGVDAGPVAAQQRLAEPGEHHAAGQVGRPPGSAPGWRRPAAPARGRRARAAPRPAAASRSHARSSVVTTVASEDARCWARKIRNTAASSSGRALQLGDAVVAQRLGQLAPGTPPAARPAPRRGSAGRCGSARGRCARGCRRRLLAGGPVAAQLGQVGEHRRAARAPRPAGAGRPRWPPGARRGSRRAPGARRAGRRRSRAAGCAGPPGRARPARAAGTVRGAAGRSSSTASAVGRRRPRRRRRPAAPAAAAGRRSPPGCPPTRRIP